MLFQNYGSVVYVKNSHLVLHGLVVKHNLLIFFLQCRYHYVPVLVQVNLIRLRHDSAFYLHLRLLELLDHLLLILSKRGLCDRNLLAVRNSDHQGVPLECEALRYHTSGHYLLVETVPLY